ncbi:hypothetical protein HA402_002381 [Bradysia odoriphaga]|nr:hypothetical protein HA402_002381 [Bradysia odoriphaga]
MLSQENTGNNGVNGYQANAGLIVSKVDHMTNTFKEGNSFSRSDLILGTKQWSKNIVAKINEEFDADSVIDEIRKRSETILSRELSYADHVIPYAFMLMKVTGTATTNLARLIISRITKGQILIEIPMVNPSRLVDALCDEKEEFGIEENHEDTWHWWNELRSTADFTDKMSIALELSADIPSKWEMFRWQGEPIGCLIIPSHLFIRNRQNYPVLTKAHQNLILRFKEVINNIALMVKCNMEDDNLRFYANHLRELLNSRPTADPMYGSDDLLQVPLQPLYDNLDANTYEVFETDPIKYLFYQKAIERALVDLVDQKEIDTKTIIIMVVGAGRGPLVRSSLNAAAKTGRKIKIYAIEKNPHAINTLQALIDELWNDKDIELVAQDMRKFNPPEKADILVSELLGSFGDNELSPECLDGALQLLKPTGISIPSKYTSYVNPVMSFKAHNLIRCNEKSNPRDRISSPQHRSERMYVAYLKNVFHIANPQPLFEFVHPNWSKTIDNSRFATVTFETKIDCVLTGFAGYFDTVLYKDIGLSIHPETHTKGLWSWFPVYFPLTEPIQLKSGNRIVANFWRSMGQNKVWYEWSVSKPTITHIHNLKGMHYVIYL